MRDRGICTIREGSRTAWVVPVGGPTRSSDYGNTHKVRQGLLTPNYPRLCLGNAPSGYWASLGTAGVFNVQFAENPAAKETFLGLG